MRPCSTSSQTASRACSARSARAGKLSEDDVKKALREVRLALLEADVNFKVVKDFTDVAARAARRAPRSRRP